MTEMKNHSPKKIPLTGSGQDERLKAPTRYFSTMQILLGISVQCRYS